MLSYLKKVLSWDYWIDLIWRAVLPLLIICVILTISLILSTLTYSFIRHQLVPSVLIREPVYFNFEQSKPSARINLLSDRKQWSTNGNGLSDTPTQVDQDAKSITVLPRFLKSESAYYLYSTMHTTKSSRNREIGKFMLHCSLIDGTGGVVASSSRPVAMPYKSTLYTFLEDLVNFPFMYVGAIGGDSSSIHVPLINNFIEPRYTKPPTEYVELLLSTNQADVSYATLTIMPALTGLS